MPRAHTAAPTDKTMWRCLLRRCHPDAGRDHDLFIWSKMLFEHVSGVGLEEAPREAKRKPPSMRLRPIGS